MSDSIKYNKSKAYERYTLALTDSNPERFTNNKLMTNWLLCKGLSLNEYPKDICGYRKTFKSHVDQKSIIELLVGLATQLGYIIEDCKTHSTVQLPLNENEHESLWRQGYVMTKLFAIIMRNCGSDNFSICDIGYNLYAGLAEYVNIHGVFGYSDETTVYSDRIKTLDLINDSNYGMLTWLHHPYYCKTIFSLGVSFMEAKGEVSFKIRGSRIYSSYNKYTDTYEPWFKGGPENGIYDNEESLFKALIADIQIVTDNCESKTRHKYQKALKTLRQYYYKHFDASFGVVSENERKPKLTNQLVLF